MAVRRFDKYQLSVSEQLKMFVDSVMPGRYLFFATKVTGYHHGSLDL